MLRYRSGWLCALLDLRDRLLWLLDQPDEAGTLAQGSLRAWRQHVYAHSTERDFADGISQVVAYGMVLAILTTRLMRTTRSGSSPSPKRVLQFAYRALCSRRRSVRSLIGQRSPKRFRWNLALLRRWSALLTRAVSTKAPIVAATPGCSFMRISLASMIQMSDGRRECTSRPSTSFEAMVAIADHLLVERFGRRLGFADPQVVTLDPATGTGTFPLAVIDKAVARAVAARGEAGERQAAANLGQTLHAFEILPGPYSVAHLRLTQRLAALSNGHVGVARVILTDTLELPLEMVDQYALFGDAETLATEQSRARHIKLEQRVTVVIGNPPYRRVEREADGHGSGGWVVEGRVPGRNNARSLFADIYDIANQHTIFS